jgi:hypothetical protein
MPMRKQGKSVKGFLIASGVAIAVAGLGIVLLGIPGALIFELTFPMASLLVGVSKSTIPADAMWPIAIVMTLVWPLSFPAGYLVAWGVFANQKRLTKWLILLGVSLMWGLVLTTYFAWSAAKP